MTVNICPSYSGRSMWIFLGGRIIGEIEAAHAHLIQGAVLVSPDDPSIFSDKGRQTKPPGDPINHLRTAFRIALALHGKLAWMAEQGMWPEDLRWSRGAAEDAVSDMRSMLRQADQPEHVAHLSVRLIPRALVRDILEAASNGGGLSFTPVEVQELAASIEETEAALPSLPPAANDGAQAAGKVA